MRSQAMYLVHNTARFRLESGVLQKLTGDRVRGPDADPAAPENDVALARPFADCAVVRVARESEPLLVAAAHAQVRTRAGRARNCHAAVARDDLEWRGGIPGADADELAVTNRDLVPVFGEGAARRKFADAAAADAELIGVDRPRDVEAVLWRRIGDADVPFLRGAEQDVAVSADGEFHLLLATELEPALRGTADTHVAGWAEYEAGRGRLEPRRGPRDRCRRAIPRQKAGHCRLLVAVAVVHCQKAGHCRLITIAVARDRRGGR